MRNCIYLSLFYLIDRVVEIKIARLDIQWIPKFYYEYLLPFQFIMLSIREAKGSGSAMPLWHCTATFQRTKVQITSICCIPSLFSKAQQGVAMNWF